MKAADKKALEQRLALTADRWERLAQKSDALLEKLKAQAQKIRTAPIYVSFEEAKALREIQGKYDPQAAVAPLVYAGHPVLIKENSRVPTTFDTPLLPPPDIGPLVPPSRRAGGSRAKPGEAAIRELPAERGE